MKAKKILTLFLAMLMLVSMLTVAPVSAATTTVVEATGDTLIPARDYITETSSWAGKDDEYAAAYCPTTTGDVAWKGGCVNANGNAEYSISVSETGYYSLSALTSNIQSCFNVYLDDTQVMAKKYAALNPNGGYWESVYTQLGIMYLEEGIHTIKVELTNNGFFFALKLSPYTKTIDGTEKTDVQFYKDFVSGTYPADDQGYQYYKSMAVAGATNGVENGFLVIGAGNSLTYVVNAEEAGEYNVNMVAGGEGDAVFALTVNDKAGSGMTWNYYTGDIPSGANAYTYAHEDNLGSIYLSEGENTITFNVISGSVFAYNWSLEREETTLPEPDGTISATGDTLIPARDYITETSSWAGKDEEYAAANCPTTTGDEAWEGGCVPANGNAEYSINVSKEGYYSLSALTSNIQACFNVYLDNEQVMATKYAAVNPNDGYWESVYTQLGIMYLTEGTHTIKVEVTNSGFLFALKLTPYTKTIDGTEKTDVQFYKDLVSGTYQPDDQGYQYYKSMAAAGAINGAENGFLIIGTGNSLTYVVNAEEAGVYNVNMVAGGEGDAVFTLTVNDKAGSGMTWNYYTGDIPSGANAYTYAHEDSLGSIDLNEGVNTITFNVISGSVFAYNWSLEREETTLPEPDGAADILIPAREYITSSWEGKDEGYEPESCPTTTGDEVWEGGCVPANGNAEYSINVSETGYYSLSALTSNIQACFDVYLDNEQVMATKYAAVNPNGDYWNSVYTQLGIMYLEEGTHTIKVDVTNSGFLFALKLSPYTKTIDEKAKTDVQFYKDFVSGTYPADDQGYQYYKSRAVAGAANGVENGFLLINHGNSLTYVVNAEEAGEYNVNMVAGGEGDAALTLTVNDKAGSSMTWNHYTGDIPSGANAYTYAHEDSLGSIYLNEGVNTITFNVTSGSVFAYNWSLERAYTTLTADGATIDTVEFDAGRYYATNGAEVEVYPVAPNGQPHSLVAARAGYWFEYTIDVEQAGDYTLYTNAGVGAAYGTLTNLSTGDVYYTDEQLLEIDDNFEVGTIYLEEGINTLRFDFTAGSSFFYTFTLLSDARVETILYNIPNGGTKTKTNEVLDGTMIAEVYLPEADAGKNVVVIFAIYKNGALLAADVTNEAKEAGEKRTLTIEGIEKDDSAEYTYRLLYWNSFTAINPLY